MQERFTWPAIVEQLTAEYQNVIDRHRRTGAGRRAQGRGHGRGREMTGLTAKARKLAGILAVPA